MKAKISLITLGVRNLEKSLTFYRDGLGFKTHNYKKEQGIVFFKMEGTWLAIFPRDELADDANLPKALRKTGKGFSGFSLAHNVKSKKRVDEIFKLALKAGAKPIKRPQDVFWGGYSGYFADPDGYLWELAWNPHMDLT